MMTNLARTREKSSDRLEVIWYGMRLAFQGKVLRENHLLKRDDLSWKHDKLSQIDSSHVNCIDRVGKNDF